MTLYKDELFRLITSTAAMTPGHASAFLEAVLNDHAHELAEKQRAELLRNPGVFEAGLIDLIDPEVEK